MAAHEYPIFASKNPSYCPLRSRGSWTISSRRSHRAPTTWRCEFCGWASRRRLLFGLGDQVKLSSLIERVQKNCRSDARLFPGEHEAAATGCLGPETQEHQQHRSLRRSTEMTLRIVMCSRKTPAGDIPNLGVARVGRPEDDDGWKTLEWELRSFVCKGEYEAVSGDSRGISQAPQPATTACVGQWL